ncbi:DUF2339 domain-containing protein [Planctomicrobium piriforme]|uniref:Uncharacterized protein n=1 Tax=Planctomicrobium piriforme TaxID=1576369 RepID=A0A1I3H007_9PLAN|nr:hypothetical protein [Planctomicrobium piriforme]SFI28902.1 hypothetical protein SAMN05421753_107193 [Planctomicrobium piriforme]
MFDQAASKTRRNQPFNWWERFLNPLRASGEPGEVCRPLLGLLLGIFCGLGAMVAVARLPIPDPIDVVGVPLVKGYSEKAEHLAFYAFLVVVVAAVPACRRLVDKLPSAWISALFAIILWWWLLSEVLGHKSMLALLVCLAAVGGVMVWLRLPSQRSVLMWLIPVCLWGWTFQHAPLPLVDVSHFFVWPVLVATLGLAIALHRNSGRSSEIWAWVAPVTALAMLFGDFFLHRGQMSPALPGIFAVLAGADAGVQQKLKEWIGRAPWLALLIFIVALAGLRMNPYDWLLPQLVVNASMIGLMILVASAARGERGDTGGVIAVCKDWFPCAAGLLGIYVVWQLWSWFGLLMSGLLLTLWMAQRHRQIGLNRAWLPALLLAVAALPGIGWTFTLDPFHDGQQLSAVWEFEQGRKLYSEVFPLRGAGFFGVWLSWLILPPTLGSSHLCDFLCVPLMMSGASLATFAWTRSASWSLAAGLLLSPWMYGSGGEFREGVFLCLLALTMFCLTSNSKWRWLWCVPIGVASLLAGFDVMASIIPPMAAAVLLSRLPPRGNTTLFQALLSGATRAGWIAFLPVIAFACLIAAWQGVVPALTYWTLFLDDSKYLNAFFGLPMSELQLRWQQILLSLAGLGLFVGGCTLAWPQMSESRRRLAVLIASSFAMYAHRVLGRSDAVHLEMILCLVYLIWLFNVFAGVRFLARHNVAGIRNRLQLAGLLLAAGIVWQLRGLPSNPLAFISALRRAPSTETVISPPVPEILERIPAGQFLWPVEYGIGNYLYQRLNPTRHAIAYSIGTPNEERRVVENLREFPTPVILWDWAKIDEIDGLVRHYPIAMSVLRTYQPVLEEFEGDVPLIAVPADSSWTGVDELPEGFLPNQKLGLLAGKWGELRWPRLQEQILKQEELQNWTQSTPEEGKRHWEWSGVIAPRSFNYLLLTMTAVRSEISTEIETTATLRFAPATLLEKEPQITFQVFADGKRRTYLIPIGCHPGWTWRPQIRRLQLSTPANVRLSLQSARLYDIDEWSTPKAQQK